MPSQDGPHGTLPEEVPAIIPKLRLPRMVSGDALVATPADGFDPVRPRDADGREIRGGYRIAWGGQELTVAAFHRYVREGERHWRWLLIVEPNPAGLWAVPVGSADRPVLVIDPPGTAPAAQSTDALLHRLRELVAERRTGLYPDNASGDEWVSVFDELDYRMSRPGYPIPTQWRDR